MAELSGNGKVGIPWERIAMFLQASLLAAGGYVWNETVADLKSEQAINQKQEQQLIRIDTLREAAEWRNAELERRLSKIDEKLERLLGQK